MKGKAKQKKKIGSIILIGMGFFLTAILTFTSTLAWFYDSDWASKYINMAGTVGIEIRRELQPGEDPALTNLKTSGSGNLYFKLFNEDPKNPKSMLAYPGQSIDVSASVYNNGGRSGSNGSECYVRAHFAVYTNIGKIPVASDYEGGETSNAYKFAAELAGSTAGLVASDYVGGANAPAFIRDNTAAQTEAGLNAKNFYIFLNSLITKQNGTNPGYYWQYYQHTGAMPLSNSGTSDQDVNYYYEGKQVKDGTDDVTDVTTLVDKGYFYLCTNSTDGILQPLGREDTAIFLWNDTFVIPWQLTNDSADKRIFVAVTFQAIQTFIPKISASGIINADADNRLPVDQCLYYCDPVQTVFNSCNFEPIDTKITLANGSVIDFGDDSKYDSITTPTDANS